MISGGVRAPSEVSGLQLELTSGNQRAVVVEVGGGIRTYFADGRDLLDGYGLDEPSTAGRGQVLMPWPNRVEDGRYEFEGEAHQLALDEPELQNAIHGLVRAATWTVREHETDRVVMEHHLEPRRGYPFSLALNVEYVLSDSGLQVRTTATNVGADRCPFGSGAHPYLTVGTQVVDDAILRLPARTVLRSDRRGIPVGAAPLADTVYDFRRARRIGTTRLDHCFTGLERDEEGLARVELRPPRDAIGVALWMDAAYPYVMLFTGDSQPSVDRRSLAVEPMSCPPNAFRTGEALVALEPGSSWVGKWGIEPLRAPSRKPTKSRE